MRTSKPLAMLALLQDSVLIEHGAACLAAMSLRSPTNSAKIVECGAIEVLVRCMRSHSDKSSMQRQGQSARIHATAHTHTHTIISLNHRKRATGTFTKMCNHLIYSTCPTQHNTQAVCALGILLGDAQI